MYIFKVKGNNWSNQWSEIKGSQSKIVVNETKKTKQKINFKYICSQYSKPFKKNI